MQKIPTMFVRDELTTGHPITDEWKPECIWVRQGEGVPTAKLDGTNIRIESGQLFKRQKPKERDYDDAAYVPCDRANPADRWAWEAFDSACSFLIGPVRIPPDDGIYELIGPKIQGNPHQQPTHLLVRVVPPALSLQLMAVEPPRTWEGIRRYFAGDAGVAFEFEGIVFHHPDGRMAKIKRRDFGLKWPPSSTR